METTCDFCGAIKETYEAKEEGVVSNFAQVSIAGPHMGKHICGNCYQQKLPISVFSACYLDLADGPHEGFVMNHSFASEEPTYIVVARGLDYDGEPQEYVLLTEIPAEIVRPREGETVPQELLDEWLSATTSAQPETH